MASEGSENFIKTIEVKQSTRNVFHQRFTFTVRAERVQKQKETLHDTKLRKINMLKASRQADLQLECHCVVAKEIGLERQLPVTVFDSALLKCLI